jgi:hypothetical protein
VQLLPRLSYIRFTTTIDTRADTNDEPTAVATTACKVVLVPDSYRVWRCTGPASFAPLRRGFFLSALLISARMAEPQVDVRYGSKADVTLSNFDVRFTPRKRTFAHAIRMSALGQSICAPTLLGRSD